MKKLIIIITTILYCSFVNSQEVASPALGIKLERTIPYALIEDVFYTDVTVEIQSADYDDNWEGVDIKVIDNKTKRIIYGKHWKKSYLYGFPNSALQIGRGDALIQVVIYYDKDLKVWIMSIKEKGLY